MNDRNDGSKIGGGLYSPRIWEVNVQITKKEKMIKKEKGGEREIRRRSSNGKRKAESKWREHDRSPTREPVLIRIPVMAASPLTWQR